MKGTVVQVGDAALKCCPCPTGWQGRDRYTMRSGAMHVCRDVRTMSVGELSVSGGHRTCTNYYYPPTKGPGP